MKITEERFIEIMDKEYSNRIDGDNALRGLIIMAVYIDRNKVSMVESYTNQ